MNAASQFEGHTAISPRPAEGASSTSWGEVPGATGSAPPCPEAMEASPRAVGRSIDAALAPGARLGDFEIVGVLGRGGFGIVYLARQCSLDRQVALKVTAYQGSEGRNMAQLEHEHIVQVFSETVDPSGSQQLLCMQYVPGPTLAAVLDELRRRDRREWCGAALLEIVDRLTPYPAAFEPAALRCRAVLQDADWVDTVCWIGARLAEALAYAHQRGVLHRDIKPGNILVSQYGRPMLVDFNLALRPLAVARGSADLFGGTLAYMAPEHLAAFNPADPTGPEAVGAAADLYALGLVLYEMVAGRPAFDALPAAGSPLEVLAALVAQRRRFVLTIPVPCPPSLRQTIEHCLHPDPAGRCASGTELSAALEGCREFHAVEKAAVMERRIRQSMLRHPFRWLIVLALLPHAVGSVVNISYNLIRIVSHLTAAQQAIFVKFALAYNGIVYPLGLWLAFRVVWPVYLATSDTQSSPPVKSARIDAARRQSLNWPLWAAGIACLGWLPGAVLFPAGLATLAPPLSLRESLHLGTSFVISGLIALTYSSLLVQCLVVCVFYRRLWIDLRSFRKKAVVELTPVPRRLRLFQIFAGLIPLCGAVLMVTIGPQEFTATEYRSFRFLVTALIGLGMLGFQLAMVSTQLLSQAIAVLTRTTEIER